MLFLDESGDHNLKRINPQYPVFVLGGVIMDRAYVRDVVDPRMRAFKQRFFGREDVILHTVDMSRGRGDYAFLANEPTRNQFYSELNQMLDELEYKVIACVIRKDRHVAKYGDNAADPYMYSLDILTERICKDLGENLDGGFICAEKRNPGLDRDLLDAWSDLVTGGAGTGFVKSSEIDARIVGFELKDKKPNSAGMQLADLVITPIGRHLVGKPARSSEVDWKVIEKKLRRVEGTYRGTGLIIRP